MKLYAKSPAVTDYREFPDRGHALVIDSGWSQIADAALAWLARHGLLGADFAEIGGKAYLRFSRFSSWPGSL